MTAILKDDSNFEGFVGELRKPDKLPSETVR
jgi:hypothetical protein